MSSPGGERAAAVRHAQRASGQAAALAGMIAAVAHPLAAGALVVLVIVLFLVLGGQG